MRNYIKDAEEMLGKAYEELALVKKTHDAYRMREVAEKGYLASSDAVDALTLKKLTKVCTSHGGREDCIIEIEENNPNISGLATSFAAVVELLHTRCAYEQECTISVLEVGLRNSRNVIDAVKSAI